MNLKHYIKQFSRSYNKIPIAKRAMQKAPIEKTAFLNSQTIELLVAKI